MRSHLPRPTYLHEGDYCDRGRMDAVAWLLHFLMRVSKGDLEFNRRLVAKAERELCRDLEISRKTLSELVIRCDALDPEARVQYFEDWCDDHGIIVHD